MFIMGAIKTQPQFNAHLKMHKIKEIPNNGYINLDWLFNKISAFMRAMDYGNLQVLSKPKLKLDTSTYIWNNYKILSSNSTVNSKDRVSFEDNNIVIEKKSR